MLDIHSETQRIVRGNTLQDEDLLDITVNVKRIVRHSKTRKIVKSALPVVKIEIIFYQSVKNRVSCLSNYMLNTNEFKLINKMYSVIKIILFNLLMSA